LKIADDTRRAFPNIFATHVILKAGTESTLVVAAPDASVWFDVEGQVHRKLHITDSTLMVVRPDGYIGLRCQPADGEALINYLERYLVRTH
jgi:hypothetical protein